MRSFLQPALLMLFAAIPTLGDTSMKVEELNKQTIISFFEEFSEGRTDDAFQRVSDEVLWWVPESLPFGGTKSKAQYLQIVKSIRANFPNGFSLTVKSLVAEGDRVAVEAESLGQHINGKTYNNHYHFLFVLHSSQIIEVKEYMDTLHLFQLNSK